MTTKPFPPALVIEDPSSAKALPAADDIFEVPAASAPVVEGAPSSAVVDEDGKAATGLPAGAVENEDGSITLQLAYPVSIQVRSSSGTVRTEAFGTLTFHRLLGKDIRAISEAPDGSKPAVLLARSARIKEAIAARLFDEMDSADVTNMSAVAQHFFDGGRRTRTS